MAVYFWIPAAGNLIFAIFTMIKLAKVFGKKGGFACGLIFLSIVFLPILAFSSGGNTGRTRCERI